MTTGASGQSGSGGDALRALTDDLRRLVREELAAAQQELMGKAQRAKTAAALLGGAGMLGGLALGAGSTALTRALEQVLPRATAALAASAICASGAAALAAVGLNELRRTLPVVPVQTVESMREQVRSATTEATRRST
jgi:hypothetical protein